MPLSHQKMLRQSLDIIERSSFEGDRQDKGQNHLEPVYISQRGERNSGTSLRDCTLWLIFSLVSNSTLKSPAELLMQMFDATSPAGTL